MNTNEILIKLNEQAIEAVSLGNTNQYNAIVLHDIIRESQKIPNEERNQWLRQQFYHTTEMRDKMVASEKYCDAFMQLIHHHEVEIAIPEHVMNTCKHLRKSIEQVRKAMISYRDLFAVE